jgi:hypothetical protein
LLPLAARARQVELLLRQTAHVQEIVAVGAADRPDLDIDPEGRLALALILNTCP